MDETVTINICLPKTLLIALDEWAKQQYFSRSGAIQQLIKEEIIKK